MQCKCGNEIRHVPEHLRELADWRCQQCSNAAPNVNYKQSDHRAHRHPQTDNSQQAA